MRKVSREEVGLDLVELSFKDQYITRSDMWRFTCSLVREGRGGEGGREGGKKEERERDRERDREKERGGKGGKVGGREGRRERGREGGRSMGVVIKKEEERRRRGVWERKEAGEGKGMGQSSFIRHDIRHTTTHLPLHS